MLKFTYQLNTAAQRPFGMSPVETLRPSLRVVTDRIDAAAIAEKGEVAS